MASARNRETAPSQGTEESHGGGNPAVSRDLPSSRPAYGRAPSMRSINVISDDGSDRADGRSMLNYVIGRNIVSSSDDIANVTGPISSASQATEPEDDYGKSGSEYNTDEDDDEGKGNSDEEDPTTDQDDSTVSSTLSPQFMSASMTAVDVEFVGDRTVKPSRSHRSTRSKSVRSNKSGRSVRSNRSNRSVKSSLSQTPIADRFSEENFAKADSAISNGLDYEEKSMHTAETHFTEDDLGSTMTYGENGLYTTESGNEITTDPTHPSYDEKARQDKLDRTSRFAMIKAKFMSRATLLWIFGVIILGSVVLNVYFVVNRSSITRHTLESIPQKQVPVFRPAPISPVKSETPLKGITRDIITSSDPEVERLLNDPSLRQVLYGVDYSPLNVQYPHCGVTQRDVTLDLAILSQITDKIRLYGTDCRQAEYVLNAFIDLNLNMTLSLGVWVDRSYEGSSRQLDEMQRLVTKYPTKYFDSILVGNEVLFRGDLSESELISYIVRTQDFLKSRDIDIPVGTSDIGSKWTPRLASIVDVLAANIHPFFGGVPVAVSTNWTYQFLYEQVLTDIETWDRVPSQIVISEVGWPSGGGRILGSVAGVNEQQKFLTDWVCSKLATAEVGWYWFEAFDEPWKIIYHNGEDRWETQWGIFTSNRKLKDGVKMPICSESDID